MKSQVLMPDTIRNLAGDFLDDKKKQISRRTTDAVLRLAGNTSLRTIEFLERRHNPKEKTQNDHRDKSCISSFLFFSCYFELNGSFCYGLGERGYFSFLQAYGFSSYETGITVVTSSPFWQQRLKLGIWCFWQIRSDIFSM